ncbi:alpha,alpha-trehalose-phosphate synthase (UDP-forming) [Acetobacter ghanensis]|uniref:Alpha,alpha-trehalose-phosphate synthase (UDP-forming) n=1 Tax=Acetobacter ghanensis TaxID=431306 RepID=A0A0U5F1M5_9PROT|nr:trehalose-6-phosphate synthase [Acetobacter ghanensis]NHO39350.1 trehalose-6-phosphate synthase [Acetobacter ghanensis]GBQ47811.1 alpha,alpha-trehalose-phosphate synthase [Acetobacter ghanensis DSM 18895]CEF54396.1 alpha,alpha-trehalose-phosphate synthase (UDP-forming) [Acetobacter ghanensis]
MRRLVIVSNRVPALRGRKQPAGGLAVALKDAVRDHPCLWFGWSGQQIGGDSADRPLNVDTVGNVTYATIGLTQREYNGFYQGYSNGILWPLCHYRAGLMNYSRHDQQIYDDVNTVFANSLAPLLEDGDVVWVHDYHLFPLGKALRHLKVKARIGFFLHIPFPPWSLMRSLPEAASLMRALRAYDVIGVQTEDDARNMNEAFSVLGIPARARVFPIGIDPDSFAACAREGQSLPQVQRLKQELRGMPLIIGVDRMDYSKGLPERLRGYATFLKRYPEYRGKVVYLQITPVSRGSVPEYQSLRAELDQIVGHINGTYGEFDWTPVRYLTHPLPRELLAAFFQLSSAALVTPLRDGMNLVAKEYVAAQQPDDPGMLILSRFAGAAPDMEDALLVNPHDSDEIASALHMALSMSGSERRLRWERLRTDVWRVTAANWARSFIAALSEVRTA